MFTSKDGKLVKPCPFCGGEPLIESLLRNGCRHGEPDARAYFLRCRSCAAEGPWTKNRNGAFRMWNMRTPEPLMNRIARSANAGNQQTVPER